MASKTLLLLPIFPAFLLLFLSIPSFARPLPPFVPYRPFDAIYSFGDSIADTGNLVREGQLGSFEAITRLPYGETFFKNATGRCSNGRLMIDFLAERIGLPFINPYLDTTASFSNGVNFAVAGATALDSAYLRSTGLYMPYTNSSLTVQLGWFENHLKSLCSSITEAECRNKLARALFLVGEIGGNDYNYAFFQGKTIEEATALVPQVVHTIQKAAASVIGHGARHLVVPGNFPIGCTPSYLTAFRSTNASDYDERMCLRSFNDFAEYHNNELQEMLRSLRREFPLVRIQYADYYHALLEILDKASKTLGFDGKSLLKACCGGGGDLNFDPRSMCGAPGAASVCTDPSKYISWDGIHLTEEAYKDMVVFLFLGNLKG